MVSLVNGEQILTGIGIFYNGMCVRVRAMHTVMTIYRQTWKETTRGAGRFSNTSRVDCGCLFETNVFDFNSSCPCVSGRKKFFYKII